MSWRLIVFNVHNLRRRNRLEVRKKRYARQITNALMMRVRRYLKSLKDRLVRRMVNGYAKAIYLHKAISSRALHQLIDFWVEKRPPGECLEMLRSYIDRADANPYALANAVIVALKNADVASARGYSAKLLSACPTDFGAHQQAAIWFFLRGYYDDAEKIWSETTEQREQAIEKAGLNARNLRLLGPSWLLAIGHIAHIDIYIKNKIMTGAESQKSIMVMPLSGKVPNMALLECWKPYITIGTPKMPLGLSLSQVEMLQDEFWSIRLEPGLTRMFSHAGALVQQAWDAQGRPPLLKLEATMEEHGWTHMERMGLPRDGWFICLHVREAGFHKAWHEKHPSTRNADVLTYMKAVQTILDRGGYVVRMGDSTMTPLPRMNGLIDYATSDSKSEELDIFLCAKARFFIGTNSGLGLVPPIFGVPCAMTNWSPIALPQWYPRDRFIPKKIYSRALGRCLTLDEMFSTPAGWEQFIKYFDDNQLYVIDNTPEEINELVIEMLAELDGFAEVTPQDARLAAAYEALAHRTGSYLGARIGLQFLRENSTHLIETN